MTKKYKSCKKQSEKAWSEIIGKRNIGICARDEWVIQVLKLSKIPKELNKNDNK
jgi:hypothetical protein